MSREPILLSHISRRAVAAEEVRWPTHRFVLEITAGVTPVLGEEIYVEQVIRNLLTNAAKYSEPDSEIDVILDQTEDAVLVRVLDSGIGIEPDDAGHLFDLFFRSTTAVRQAAGAGIGLFVCKQLVDAMGGRIYGMARPGGGAEFGFSLPVDIEQDLIPEL